MQSTRPIIVGASFRTAQAGLRERLYLDQASRQEAYRKLAELGLSQAVILSTCDRVEIIACTDDEEGALRQLETFLAARTEMPPKQVTEQLFRYCDEEAVQHLFQVISALDSQMIGEAQILGQIKEAVAEAAAADMIGSELDELLQAGFNLAKRVRSQTKIGEGAVSVASAAIRFARDLHGDLSNCRGLLIGLGETGLLMHEQFSHAGLEQWMLTGSARRTERVAGRLNCHYLPWENLATGIARADVIVTASGSGRFLVTLPQIRQALKERRHKPIFLLDTGIPADIDPALEEERDAFLYTLEDIERLAERGQRDRQDAADEARRIVRETVAEYRHAQAEKEGVPALVGLRALFNQTRDGVLADHPNADASEATRLLVNRLLHRPSEALRGMAGEGDAADFRDTITVNRILERMFGISDINAPKADRDGEGENE
ncbi:glutamyl-tRNA reductase [Aestuariispira ectoiniformans]|uniref:glutamyl-tRNA reductase n=1 Tax=Aestuariispira ectoiniformans TaxID=2775080 RepID=UPI00223C2DD0|nr:glutamyl-tRNA reductase [Aestuariispira ectoiniformans]